MRWRDGKRVHECCRRLRVGDLQAVMGCGEGWRLSDVRVMVVEARQEW